MNDISNVKVHLRTRSGNENVAFYGDLSGLYRKLFYGNAFGNEQHKEIIGIYVT